MQRFELSVGEPWDFTGPDGANRIEVEFVGFVSGPDKPNWQARYALLNVPRPFTMSGEVVQTIIAGSRYVGTSIEQVVSEGGTVGVSRVRPGARISCGGTFEPDDVEYVIIGGLNVLKDPAV